MTPVRIDVMGKVTPIAHDTQSCHAQLERSALRLMISCLGVHGMAGRVGIGLTVSVIRALGDPRAADFLLPYLKFLLHRVPEYCSHNSSSCIHEGKFTSSHGRSDQIRVWGKGKTLESARSSHPYKLLQSAP